MLNIYINTTHNKDNTGYVYYETESKYDTYLNNYLYESISEEYYYLQDNHIIIPSKFSDKLNQITYIKESKSNYTRYYHVNNTYIDSTGVHLMIIVDLWATGLLTAKINDIRVIRSNINLLSDVNNVHAILDPIGAVKSQRFLKSIDYDLTAKDLYVVFLLNYNLKEDIFTRTSSTQTNLFAAKVSTLKNEYVKAWHEILGGGTDENAQNLMNAAMTTLDNSISFALKWVGQINSIKDNSNNYKCQVLKAWVVPQEFIKLNTTTFGGQIKYNYLTFNTPNGNFVGFQVDPNDVRKNFEIKDFNYNYDYYFGTKYTQIKLARYPVNESTYVNDNKFDMRVITKNDGIEVYFNQGANSIDATSIFAADITFSEGSITNLQAINNALKTANGLSRATIGIGASAFKGDAFNVATSVIDVGTGIHDMKAAVPLGSFQNYGDATLTFEQITNDKYNVKNKEITFGNIVCPYYLAFYESLIEQHDLINRNGAIYNCESNISLNHVLTSKLLVECNLTYPIFISAIVNVSDTLNDYADFISNVFAKGCRIFYAK